MTVQTSLCSRKAWAVAEAGSRLTSNPPQSNAFTHKRFVFDREDIILQGGCRWQHQGALWWRFAVFSVRDGHDSTEWELEESRCAVGAIRVVSTQGTGGTGSSSVINLGSDTGLRGLTSTASHNWVTHRGRPTQAIMWRGGGGGGFTHK